MLEGHLCTVLASLLAPDQWLDKELMGPGHQTSKEQGELVQNPWEAVEEPWDTGRGSVELGNAVVVMKSYGVPQCPSEWCWWLLLL